LNELLTHKPSGRSCIHLTTHKVSSHKEHIKKLIYEYKIDPTRVDSDGRTCLHYCQNENVADILITAGVDVSVICHYGYSVVSNPSNLAGLMHCVRGCVVHRALRQRPDLVTYKTIEHFFLQHKSDSSVLLRVLEFYKTKEPSLLLQLKDWIFQAWNEVFVKRLESPKEFWENRELCQSIVTSKEETLMWLVRTPKNYAGLSKPPPRNSNGEPPLFTWIELKLQFALIVLQDPKYYHLETCLTVIDNQGRTALIVAAQARNYKAFKWIIAWWQSHGKLDLVHHKDNNGLTALQYAELEAAKPPTVRCNRHDGRSKYALAVLRKKIGPPLTDTGK